MLLMLAVGACESGRTPTAEPTPADESSRALQEYGAKVASARDRAPMLDRLPWCALEPAAEPLAALCRIGQQANRAHFECDKPELLGRCRSMSIWTCRYDALPPVRFEVFLDYEAPQWKDGEALDTSKVPFSGAVRAVKIHFQHADATKRSALASSIQKRIDTAGCFEGRCKGATIKVTDSEYTSDVTVHGWLEGYNCP